jgi:hypothetical protein
MFTDHYKPISVCKVGNRPDKEPDNGDKAEDIKNEGRSLPSKHDLIGEYEEVETNR